MLQLSGVAVADNTQGRGPLFYSSVDIGLSNMDEDLFFLTFIEQGIKAGGLNVVLSAPLRFTIMDKNPEDEHLLRTCDWDDPSDFARILRTLDFEHRWKKGELSAHFGELNGESIGHGTIVGNYYNSTNMDYYQGGLVFGFDIEGNGLEYMMHNVIEPAIFVGRGHVTPLAWFSDAPFARRIELGASLAFDRGVNGRVLNSDRSSMLIAGGDLTVFVIKKESKTLKTYLDIMGQDGDIGIHLGVSAKFKFSKNHNYYLFAAAEYIYAGDDYYPSLINPFYDLNRRFFTLDSATGKYNTFAEHLANTDVPSSDDHGFMIDLSFNFNRFVRVGTHLAYQGDNHPELLLFRLELSPCKSFSLRGYFAGQDIYGGWKLFSSDSLIGIAIHQKIAGPLRLFAEFQRRFRFSKEDTRWPVANEFTGGAGLIFEWQPSL
jgi:hypothetical protein